MDLFVADFEAHYVQREKLGAGGFGSVYAGTRKADNLPASTAVLLNGKTPMITFEVLLMQQVARGPNAVGKSPTVSLDDWYDLEHEVLLVMERPVLSMDLLKYSDSLGLLEEDVAKQLVEAAIHMHSKGVFHCDIKLENILTEPKFGCGCFEKRRYKDFSGTRAFIPPELYRNGTYTARPTTVWQLGTLVYEMRAGHSWFTTEKFLNNKKKTKLNCQDFLYLCLALKPEERITLEQMQKHPWLSQLCTTQNINQHFSVL
uniref:non-specific serine/threonine protein kinase n=1 Tax=Monopterus albus TaxID=43700 RepID=A0A3Q3IUB3_MONAL